MLQSFARYADDSGHQGPLTTELALQWARLPERSARLYQARRLEVVRTLARYLAPRGPGTEIPPSGLLGPAHARGPAFLYSESDIAALIEAARKPMTRAEWEAFVRSMAGSITDPTFGRPSQLPLETRGSLS